MNDESLKKRSEEPTSWEHIHSLFADVRRNLAKLQSMDEGTGNELLRRRAREYATGAATNGEDVGERLDVLQFALGTDTYAIPCDEIEEVIPMQNLVALPHTNKSFPGISSNRGLLFVVVDLKRVLNIPASDLTTMHRLIILRHEQFQIGLLVDVVHGMRSMHMDKLRELPSEMNSATRRYLQGVAADKVLLLKTDMVVSEISAMGNMFGQQDTRQFFEQHKKVQA